RCGRDAAGPRRQGLPDRSSGEDLMTELTETKPLADSNDGLAVLEGRGTVAETYGIPLAVLAELTHRCPLQCPYCSNPLALDRAGDELGTDVWQRVLGEAAALGCLQVHFSGGEPTARRDLEQLVKQAADCGLYTNLITSGVLLDDPRLARLAQAGLEHVQLSFQDANAAGADRIAGFAGHGKKIAAAAKIRAAGLPL